MPHIPPITDAYIDEIIKAPDAYNPTINKTQGVKLRELIKLMRDKIQSSNSGEDSEVVINEYNPSKSYAIGDVVYVKDEYGNRILYQSLINNNINTFYSGGLAIPNVEFGNPAPIIGLEGIILPFPLYGYEYDEDLTFTYKGYYLENNEYKPYDAFTVKLKKQDGRRFGFYFSQTTVPPNAQPPVPTFDYVTIKIKTSNDESQNTEIIADKIVADNLRFYYETPEGLRLKIKLDIGTNEQVIDISGIITGWYLLGYPEFKLDTSGFIDTSEQPQTKAGPLQLNSNFSNKQKRVLYSINPYNQRDTQNGYIEEITEQYDVDGEQVGNFVILGNHFSEGYFTNSIELAVTSYNGSINKKWSLFSDTIRGGNWFTVLPVNEGVQYNGGGDVDLEVKYVYPYGYWFRLRVKTAGGIGGIALYTKSYQGTFYKWNTSSENIIGPVIGNDTVATDDFIGDKGYAKTLKVYSAPIEDNDVVRLKDLNDHGGNSPTGQYIEASPLAPQVANINLDGDISAKSAIRSEQYLIASLPNSTKFAAIGTENSTVGFGVGLSDDINNILTSYGSEGIAYRNLGSAWTTYIKPTQEILTEAVTIFAPNKSGILALVSDVSENFLSLTGGTLTGNLYLNNLTDGQNDDYRIIVANNEQNKVKYVNKTDAPWLLKNTAIPQSGTSLFLGDFNNNILFDGLGLQGLNNNINAASIRMSGGGGWNINSSNTKFLMDDLESLVISDNIYVYKSMLRGSDFAPVLYRGDALPLEGGNLSGDLAIGSPYKFYGSIQGTNGNFESLNLSGTYRLSNNDNRFVWDNFIDFNGDYKTKNIGNNHGIGLHYDTGVLYDIYDNKYYLKQGDALPLIGGEVIGNISAPTFNNIIIDFNKGGTFNTRLGIDLFGENIIGSSNVAIGQAALKLLNNGSSNLGIGDYAGAGLTTGSSNVVIGANALRGSAETNSAVAIGKDALSGSGNYSNSVAIGHGAGVNSNGGANVYLGSDAGAGNTGSGNVFIGFHAGFFYANPMSNKFIISNGQFENEGVLIKGDFITKYVEVEKLNVSDSLNLTNGDIEIDDFTKGVVLKSPNGARWRITISDTGVLTTAAL